MSITPSPIPRQEASQSGESRSYSPPAQPSVIAAEPPSKVPIIILAFVIGIGLGGSFLYSKHVNDRLDEIKSSLDGSLASQAQSLEKLNQRLAKADARNSDLAGEVTVTKSRLGTTQSEIQKAHQIAAELARQQQESAEHAEQLSSQLGQLQQEQVTTKGAVGSLSTDVVGVKGEVKSTKEELANTRSQLQRVVGDLGVQSDLIAHSRADLDELRLRGERDYFEFDLRKNNHTQKLAGVQLDLKKADPKKQRYTLTLVADDRTIEKRDKTVSEPVQFLQQGNQMPSEIVVNQIYKDRVVGYISVPKKKGDRVPMKAAS